MRRTPARLRSALAAVLIAAGGVVALAPPAAAAGSLTATLAMSGTTGTYTVANTGAASVSNWAITFTLPAGVTASTGENGTVTQNGSQVTLTPAY